jgi:hypothetical protein
MSAKLRDAHTVVIKAAGVTWRQACCCLACSAPAEHDLAILIKPHHMPAAATNVTTGSCQAAYLTFQKVTKLEVWLPL